MKEYYPVWKEKNRKKYLDYQKEYAGVHKSKKAKYDKKRREVKADELRAKKREYYLSKPEWFKARAAEWIRKNPHKRKAIIENRRVRELSNGGSFTGEEWVILCNSYANRCLCCGRDGIPLQVDHVVPISLGGSGNISNIQPLCHSCNSSKNNRHIDYRMDWT